MRAAYMGVFMEEIGYGMKNAFQEFKDTNKIYEAHVICVSRKARGLQLGQELVYRSMVQGKTDGCQYMYAIATGVYSQRLFKNLGFRVLAEKNYDDFYDRKGNVLFNESREHKKAEVVYYKL